MKTIDEEAMQADVRFNESITESESDKLSPSDNFVEGFKRGVEFAQRWIPVSKDNPITENDSSNILVKFENGKIMRYDEFNWYNSIVTHWRPIELT